MNAGCQAKPSQAKPSQSSNWGWRLGKAQVDVPLSVAIPAFDQ